MLTAPDRYDYLPFVDPPQVRWLSEEGVAFWLAPHIELYEIDPPECQDRPFWPSFRPDALNYSLRHYRNRATVCASMEALIMSAFAPACR